MEMVIVNVYIPPKTPEKDRADFLSKLEKEWQQFGCSNIICWKRQLQEKSSKYFFRKYNAVPGSIHILYDNKGNLCNTDAGILQVCHDFYSSLYHQDSQTGDTPYAFLPTREEGQLVSPEQADKLQAEITSEELFQALQGMKKGKPQG